MLKGTSEEAILWMAELWDILHNQPLLNALITLVLPPLTMTSKSEKSDWKNHKMPSSNVTNSAHAISLLPCFHPSQRRQAAHWLPTTRLMPQEDEASTQMSGSTLWHGEREQEPPGVERTGYHQQRDSITIAGTWHWEKSFGNFDANEDKGGRADHPLCRQRWHVVKSHEGKHIHGK